MADVPPDPNRGASGTEFQTVEALRAAGHQVDAVWSDELGRRIAHGNLHLLLELPGAYERTTARHFAERDYDVVHVNQPHGHRAARWLRRHRKRAIFVHRSHGLEPYAAEVIGYWQRRSPSDKRALPRRAASAILGQLLARHMRLTAARADGHIVSSTLDAQFASERLGIEPQRIAVVPHAAPERFLTAPLLELDRSRLNTVLHVAQFAFFKAPAVTAEAMSRIAAARPDARFVWVCESADHDAVRALASPSLRERLELRHWMSQDELMSLYDSAGIFLFPSYYEGFGKAFLEAMSRGSCVVATAVGGARDLIANGSDGVLVAPGDAPAVADAALALMNDSDRARTMGATASQTARQYTWSRFADELIGFYRQLRAARGW